MTRDQKQDTPSSKVARLRCGWARFEIRDSRFQLLPPFTRSGNQAEGFRLHASISFLSRSCLFLAPTPVEQTLKYTRDDSEVVRFLSLFLIQQQYLFTARYLFRSPRWHAPSFLMECRDAIRVSPHFGSRAPARDYPRVFLSVLSTDDAHFRRVGGRDDTR